MANNNDIFELVEAYLNGKLSDRELANFEARLSIDTALQKQLKLAEAAQKAVIHNRLLQVKSLANTEFTRVETKSKTIKKYLIGGSIGLIAALTAFFFMMKSDETNKVKSEEPQKTTVEKTIPSTPKKTNSVDKNKEELLQKEPITSHKESNNKSDIKTKDDSSNQLPIITKEILPLEEKPVVVRSKSEITEEEKPEAVKTLDPICNPEKITADIHIVKGCEGKNESAIEVGKVTGLEAPVKKQLFNAENQLASSSYDLKDGNYSVVVSGSRACEKRFPVVLKSKKCPINVDFNPGFGEVWEIPISTVRGVLTIYTKTGLEIVQKTIQANEATTWNGRNENNEIQAGYFIFTINYEDGSFLKGGITVTQ